VSAYYDHHYISNSDLKKLRKILDPKFQDPADLEAIFEFGNLVEDVILQPHQANWQHKDIELAKQMCCTFSNDSICNSLLFVTDFRRQHEWYRTDRFGVPARCKMDGDSKKLDLVFELKGLSVTTEHSFEEAIDRFDYDQGLAWYLDVSGYKRALIVGVSKKTPERLFKRLIDRDHYYYKRGIAKVNKSIKLWKEMFVNTN
jgi:hypothetical protein